MRGAFDIQQLRHRFIEQGVFIRPIGKTIYLAPAYTIGLEDLSTLTVAVIRAVQDGE
ncbi:Adenosylmethionine-8-amino-7-oxononanoate aminotransferase [compost metagenome]